MDNRNPLAELFSRGSTPPATQQQQSLQQPSSNASPTQIDSLFQHLNQQQTSGRVSDTYGNSASVSSLLPLSDEPISPAASNANATNAERQNALLTLLGGGTSAMNVRGVPTQASVPASAPVVPQPVPTPPGSSQRSGSGGTPTHNEAQGKYLLEQLMAG